MLDSHWSIAATRGGGSLSFNITTLNRGDKEIKKLLVIKQEHYVAQSEQLSFVFFRRCCFDLLAHNVLTCHMTFHTVDAESRICFQNCLEFASLF